VKQKAVWLWVAGLVATGFYPPWIMEPHQFLGYGWLFAPPNVIAFIESGRLLLEWAMVTAVAAGLYFAPPKRLR
jgi:hypothetical protein